MNGRERGRWETSRGFLLFLVLPAFDKMEKIVYSFLQKDYYFS